MEHTSLTFGSFTQPSVARNLIEMLANVEKGLSQRFFVFSPSNSVINLMNWSLWTKIIL